MTKICTLCGVEKESFKFETGRGQCMTCRSKAQRERNRKRKKPKITKKRCSSCRQTKDIGTFHKNSNFSDGFHAQCKICRKKERKKLEAKNKIKNAGKTFNKHDAKRCPVCKIVKNYSEFNLSVTTSDGLSKLCRLCLKEYRKSDNFKKHERERYRNDSNLRIKSNLRRRLNNALKNNQKRGSAVGDLGCSIEYFKIYLELRFYTNSDTKEEMTWENYSYYGWHIDHIKPLSSFDLTDREQFLKACHYTNLQPLWAKENLRKGNKTA